MKGLSSYITIKSDYLTEEEQHEVNEYVADFVRSGEFIKAIRIENFGLGLPVIYMDDHDENVIVTEYSDGRITKEIAR